MICLSLYHKIYFCVGAKLSVELFIRKEQVFITTKYTTTFFINRIRKISLWFIKSIKSGDI